MTFALRLRCEYSKIELSQGILLLERMMTMGQIKENLNFYVRLDTDSGRDIPETIDLNIAEKNVEEQAIERIVNERAGAKILITESSSLMAEINESKDITKNEFANMSDDELFNS